MMKNYSSIFILAFFILLFGCKSQSVTLRSAGEREKTPGFEVQRNLILNPGENNPRNSEGDFVQLKDGRMLFVYSHYYGESSSDHATAFLAGRYSNDGGDTWTDADELVVSNEGGMNVMSVSLLRLQNGDIALFYLRKNSTEDCIPMMRVSTDEAKSWSEPLACITDRKGYFVLNNDRVIQLEDGRLIMAVARHAAPGEEWRNGADISSYHSDDNGKTWVSSGAVPNPENIVLQEPGLVELKDGAILMFLRSNAGVQSYSYSKDKGKTWSQVEKSTLISPLSPASIERIPGTGDLLAIWNNNLSEDSEEAKLRTPLNIAISKDEGKTWSNIKEIEGDPDGWYCYTAIDFVGKDLIIAHSAGNRPMGTSLDVINISKISVNSLYE